MLLNQPQIIEIQSNVLQLCMVVALERSFVNLADFIVVQFQRSQFTQEMEARVANRHQVIVAQIEFSQIDEWSKGWCWKSGHRSGQSV